MNSIEKRACEMFEEQNPGRSWGLVFRERNIGETTIIDSAREDERDRYLDLAKKEAEIQSHQK